DHVRFLATKTPHSRKGGQVYSGNPLGKCEAMTEQHFAPTNQWETAHLFSKKTTKSCSVARLLAEGILVPKRSLGTHSCETPFRTRPEAVGAGAKRSFAKVRSQTEFGNEDLLRQQPCYRATKSASHAGPGWLAPMAAMPVPGWPSRTGSEDIER